MVTLRARADLRISVRAWQVEKSARWKAEMIRKLARRARADDDFNASSSQRRDVRDGKLL